MTKPLELLELDSVGPINITANNNKYILTCIDHYTKHAMAYATERCDAKSVVDKIEQYCCTFGIPSRILTDNGTSFTAKAFKIFCETFGIKAETSTPYNPKNQGLVEKFNGTLSKMIATYNGDSDWDQYINLCVFAYNTAVHKSTKITPHEAIFGMPANTTFSSLLKRHDDNLTPSDYAQKLKARLQQIYKEIDRNQSVADKRAKEYYDKYASDKEFQIGSRVWLDNPVHKAGTSAKLQVKYKGPFTVTARPSIVNYEITPDDNKQKKQVVHQNRLKTCYSPPVAQNDDQQIITQQQIESRPLQEEPLPTPTRIDVDDDSDEEDAWFYFPETIKQPYRENKTIDTSNITTASARTNQCTNNSHQKSNSHMVTITEDEIMQSTNNGSRVNTTEVRQNESNTNDNSEISSDDATELTQLDLDYRPPPTLQFNRTAAPTRRNPERQRKIPARYTVASISYMPPHKNGEQTNSISNTISQEENCYLSDNRPKTNKSINKSNYFYLIFALINLLFLSGTYGDIIANKTNLAPLIGPSYICNTKTPHAATHLSLETTPNCVLNDPRTQKVLYIDVKPYFVRHFSQQFDIWSCQIETTTVQTFFSFFGGKSVINKWTTFRPILEAECRTHMREISQSKSSLIEIGHFVYSDKRNTVSPSYSWCCREFNTSSNHLIIHKYSAVINYFTSRLLSTNIDVNECESKKTSCKTYNEPAIIVWEDKERNHCSYSPGKEVPAKKTGDNVVSEEGQFSVTIKNTTTVCDHLTLYTTIEGLYLQIIEDSETPMYMQTQQIITYVESSEQSTTLIPMIAFVLKSLENLSYSLFARTWLSICRLQEQRYIWLKYMISKGDGAIVARMLTNSKSVFGIEVGDLLALWSCHEVQSYELNMPTQSDTCFSNIPVTYTLDAIEHTGIFIPASRSIIAYDSIRSCNTPIKKFVRSIDKQTLYLWNGTHLYHANEINYTQMHLVDALPNVTHLSLLSSLVDNAADEDTTSITSLIQSSAENVVRLLQTANGDNVIFDPNTISETAAQTVNFVAEIAKHFIHNISVTQNYINDSNSIGNCCRNSNINIDYPIYA